MSESPNESSGPAFAIRRSVTLPTKLNSQSTRGSGASNPNIAENVIYYHPSAKIVHFAPRALAPIPSSSAPSDFDYPVDTIETLPWRSATERTVATAPLRLERVHGLTVFLKCGNVVHAILKNSQCWCVDGVSKFVLRIRPLTYYRIEIPNETDDDKVRVEDLKAALPTVLRYEVTPCPFKRAFTVELPEEATAPRRKKAWRPKGRKEGAATSKGGNSLRPADSKPEFLDSASTGEDTDGAATDDSAVTPEKSESGASDNLPARDLSPSPVNTPEPFIHQMPVRRSVTELPQTFDSLRAKFDVPIIVEEQPNSEAESESDNRIEQQTPSKTTFTGQEETDEQRDPTTIITNEVNSTDIVTEQEGPSKIISEQERSEVTQDENEDIKQEPAEPLADPKSPVVIETENQPAMRTGDKAFNIFIETLEESNDDAFSTKFPEQTTAEHDIGGQYPPQISLSNLENVSPLQVNHDLLDGSSKEPCTPPSAQGNRHSTPIDSNVLGPSNSSVVENEESETVLAEVSYNKVTTPAAQDEKPRHGVETHVSGASSSENQSAEAVHFSQDGDKRSIPSNSPLAGPTIIEGEPSQIIEQQGLAQLDHESKSPKPAVSEIKEIAGSADPLTRDDNLNDLSPPTPESFHSADLDSSTGSPSTRATPVASPGKVQELKMNHGARSSSSDLKPSVLSSDMNKSSGVSNDDSSSNGGPDTEQFSRISTYQMAREDLPKPTLSIPSNPRQVSGKSASPSDLTHMSAEFRRRAQATRQRDVSPMPPPSTIYQPTPGEETASLISKALTLVLVPPIHLFIVLLHIAARIVVSPATSSTANTSQSKLQSSTEPSATEDDFSFPLEREPSSEYEDAEMTKKLDPWDLD